MREPQLLRYGMATPSITNVEAAADGAVDADISQRDLLASSSRAIADGGLLGHRQHRTGDLFPKLPCGNNYA